MKKAIQSNRGRSRGNVQKPVGRGRGTTPTRPAVRGRGTAPTRPAVRGRGNVQKPVGAISRKLPAQRPAQRATSLRNVGVSARPGMAGLAKRASTNARSGGYRKLGKK